MPHAAPTIQSRQDSLTWVQFRRRAKGGLEFWKVAAETLIGVIPVVTLAAVISRFRIRGLTMDAIKE